MRFKKNNLWLVTAIRGKLLAALRVCLEIASFPLSENDSIVQGNLYSHYGPNVPKLWKAGVYKRHGFWSI